MNTNRARLGWFVCLAVCCASLGVPEGAKRGGKPRLRHGADGRCQVPGLAATVGQEHHQ